MPYFSDSASPIAILGAMDTEVDGFLSLMNHVERREWRGFPMFRGSLFDTEVVVAKSGVGKVLSAVLTQRILDEFSPQALLFTGIGGALNPIYEIGDLVLGVDAMQYDLDATAVGFKLGQVPYTDLHIFQCDPELIAIARDCPDLTLHTGRILTGDQFLTHAGRDSHAYLVDELRGDIIEMEGASVALVCHLHQIPLLIARTVSDKANGVAPDDFLRFLPKASENSVSLVRHLFQSRA
ncbi:MAG: 5'-methylthioadenosine/adenosylhomocysteine nucleosidase [Bdellovibrionales bacterium]|nr:5'-methylthioadenosine/adenosylhomocysteine nucleosidase [Bdellovibrionales bacterium]